MDSTIIDKLVADLYWDNDDEANAETVRKMQNFVNYAVETIFQVVREKDFEVAHSAVMQYAVKLLQFGNHLDTD